MTEVSLSFALDADQRDAPLFQRRLRGGKCFAEDGLHLPLCRLVEVVHHCLPEIGFGEGTARFLLTMDGGEGVEEDLVAHIPSAGHLFELSVTVDAESDIVGRHLLRLRGASGDVP